MKTAVIGLLTSGIPQPAPLLWWPRKEHMMELGDDGIIIYTPITGEFARTYGTLTRVVAEAQRDAMITAGWRKVPPEGEGPSLNLRGIKYQGALIGMAEYRNYLLAQEEK